MLLEANINLLPRRQRDRRLVRRGSAKAAVIAKTAGDVAGRFIFIDRASSMRIVSWFLYYCTRPRPASI